MGLFSRRPRGASESPHAAFWDWWSGEGRALAEQFVDGALDWDSFAPAMSAKVEQLGPVTWELATGETTARVLVIGSDGQPATRALARQVVLAAPEPDETWSYTDARPPHPDPESVVLSLPGLPDVDLARVQVSARMGTSRFDVQVHHPSFADLPEDDRVRFTFLSLDTALGEVDTELWIGEITPVVHPPLDGFGLRALRSVVRDLRATRLDADGRPGWMMLQGRTADGPLVAMTRAPLHPLTAPHLDTYVSVTLPYTHRTDDGLPDEGSLGPLGDFESRLAGELGTSAQVVAHVSTNGSRTLHVYVDSTADALPRVRDLARAWEQGRASVHDMHDPGWEAVTHLRV